jgi:hypothetical protein
MLIIMATTTRRKTDDDTFFLSNSHGVDPNAILVKPTLSSLNEKEK